MVLQAEQGGAMSVVRTEEQDLDDACDVIVVGAGLIGAAIAARLASEGLSVAVLEARHLAAGRTDIETGVVLTGMPQHYSHAVSALGRSQAQEIWSLTCESRKRLVQYARSLGIPVDLRGSLRMASTEDEIEALGESSVLLQDDGFDAWFGRRDPMGRGFLGALGYPDDLTVDVAALTRALLDSEHITIHEGCEVRSVEMNRGGALVWSRGRMVRCSVVILAINGYAPLFDSYFKVKVTPSRILAWASEPLDELCVEQPFSARDGHTLCHQLADRRIVLEQWQSLNGRRESDVHPGDSSSSLDDALDERLSLFAEEYFPEISICRVRRWSGVTGVTADGLPLIGVLPHLPLVYFAVGFECSGLSWLFVAADRVVDLVLRGNDPGVLSDSRFG